MHNKRIGADAVILVLVLAIAVILLGACSSAEEEKKAPPQVSKNGVSTLSTELAIALENATTQTAAEEEAAAQEEPSMPLKGLLVGIDAGHQRHGNSGQEAVSPDLSETKPKVSSGTSGVYTGIPEYELNLEVAKKLKSELESRGAEVLMTREENDVDISNQERAVMMNDADADLVLRIHANGGGRAQEGAMMLVPDGHMPEDVEKESISAGEIIFAAYLEETGADNLGVILRSDMTGFNWSTVPVCLIEMGFMTNPAEDELMNTDEYQDKIVKGLANGIENWYGMKA
jgi:N-acetylmuramoyl-L-alanine amidase